MTISSNYFTRLLFSFSDLLKKPIFQIFPTGLPEFTTSDKMQHNCDWGILSMLIMDLEPFALVNR